MPALHAEQVVDAIARFVLEPGGQAMHTSAIAVGANLAVKTNTGHFVMMMAPTHMGKEENDIPASRAIFTSRLVEDVWCT